MTIPEWIEDKKLAWMDWPLTWKLGMALPGILAGWLIHLQTGWSLKPCLFFGALFGFTLPMILLNLLFSAYFLFGCFIIFGSIYWAFSDTESMQQLGGMVHVVAAGMWDLLVKLWHAIFG